MHKSIVFSAVIVLLLTSCAPLYYYQLYEAQPLGNNNDENHIIFEDDNCMVSYDLWSSGGNTGFTIYNKSDVYITLDLSKSFFVMNGEVYDYYLDRTYTVTSSAGVNSAAAISAPYYWSTGTVAVGSSLSSGSSSSIAEKARRILPPKTYITISQFRILNVPYTDCDFINFPTHKKISTVAFEQSESPYEFYNLISYQIEDTISVEMKNVFYIDKISNYPEQSFLGYKEKNNCDETYLIPQAYFPFQEPGSFYLKYRRNK